MSSAKFNPASRIALVIPCFNEAKTIQYLLDSIARSKLSEAQILLVDDSEDEETLESIQEWIQNKDNPKPNIDIIRIGRKTGRGNAALRGMRFAISRGAEYVVEFDADGSHRLADVERVVHELNYSPVVIGSRYLQDSKIVGWSISRRMFSKLLNNLIPKMFGLSVSDVTNGLRGYSREACQILLNHEFQTNSFIALTEALVTVQKREIRIAEVPSVFLERTAGKSTVGITEIYTSLKGLIALRIKESKAS